MISTSHDCILHSQRSGDSDTLADRAGKWAMFGVGAMNALRNLPLSLVDLETVRHMNSPDDEYTALFLNLAYGFGSEAAITCRNAARLQRAPKRASQSTCGSSHHIIKRGRVRLLGACICPIVLRYLRVDAEEYRLLVHGKIRPAQRTLYTLDPDY